MNDQTADHPQNTLAGHAFRKMNGLGNDFVIVDTRRSGAVMTPAAAAAIANRKTGVGCDQVITLEERAGEPFMGVWNADGSQVEACGNAARCIGWLLMEESGETAAGFSTLGGEMAASRAGDKRVTVDMGPPKLHWRQIPLAEQMDDTRYIDIKLGPIDAPVLWGPSAVNMGNPHCVFFVEDAEAQALDRFGPMIENHPLFPQRANVSGAEVRSQHMIRLRVWERGAGLTRACGTGACATAIAAMHKGLVGDTVLVSLPGGDLTISHNESRSILMAGPATESYRGSFEWSDYA